MKKKILPYNKQKFDELKKDVKQSGITAVFSDPTFPATSKSLGHVQFPSEIIWKRPGELCSAPRLFNNIEAPSRCKPGELTCDWMVSACAVLSGIKELLHKIIPDYWDQEWDPSKPDEYCGIFHFRFWQFGEWVDVVIDDALPTYDGMLISVQGESESEFWAALLEKAYAKLHGSYEALRESSLSDILVDTTAGVSQVIDLKGEEYMSNEDKRWELFETLISENNDHSIICFTIASSEEEEIGLRTDLGLKIGLAYHVTDVRKVYLGESGLRTLFKGREKVAMVRLRDASDNQWKAGSRRSSAKGAPTEYAYSTAQLTRLRSKNASWAQVKNDEFQRIGLAVQSKNEFWIPFEDLMSQFTQLTICRLFANNLFAAPIHQWFEASARGEWTTGVKWTSADKAGGSLDPETLFRNPQYLFILKEETDIVVQLMQWSPDIPPGEALKHLIGFIIVKVEDNRTTRMHKQWSHCPTVIMHDHQRKRDINYMGHLCAGRYVIIPSTYKQGETAAYFLRLFTSHNIKLRELKTDLTTSLIKCPCIHTEPEWVTVISILKAENLSLDFSFRGKDRLNPFCVVICEGAKGTTKVIKNSQNPEWNTSFLFYRRKTDVPLKLQVLSHNILIPNQLIGEAEVPALVTRSFTPLQVKLIQKQKDLEATPKACGSLFLQVLTEDNLMAI
nr:PREDICTED: calpain-5-like [Bemisia tabaci]